MYNVSLHYKLGSEKYYAEQIFVVLNRLICPSAGTLIWRDFLMLLSVFLEFSLPAPQNLSAQKFCPNFIKHHKFPPVPKSRSRKYRLLTNFLNKFRVTKFYEILAALPDGSGIARPPCRFIPSLYQAKIILKLSQKLRRTLKLIAGIMFTTSVSDEGSELRSVRDHTPLVTIPHWSGRTLWCPSVPSPRAQGLRCDPSSHHIPEWGLVLATEKPRSSFALL